MKRLNAIRLDAVNTELANMDMTADNCDVDRLDVEHDCLGYGSDLGFALAVCCTHRIEMVNDFHACNLLSNYQIYNIHE